MVKQIFRVTDMHCSSCAMRLEGLEDDLAGVKRVRASYVKQQMEVEYDETQIAATEIIAAIRRLGYTVAGVAQLPSSNTKCDQEQRHA